MGGGGDYSPSHINVKTIATIQNDEFELPDSSYSAWYIQYYI